MAARTGRAILWYVVALQASWGIMLIASSKPLRPTPLGPVTYNIPHRLAGAFFLAASALAVYALRRWTTPVRDVALLLPQQVLLTLSAIGSAHAILVGHYADGVARNHLFIGIDQSPAVLLAIWHLWAMLYQSRALQ